MDGQTIAMIGLALSVGGMALANFVRGPNAQADALLSRLRELESRHDLHAREVYAKIEMMARDINNVALKLVGEYHNRNEIRDMFSQLREDIADLKEALEHYRNGRSKPTGVG